MSLRKGVYLHEYMNESEKFNKTSLPAKEEFCINVNMEEITDAGDMYMKIVCKEFAIKSSSNYHGLYFFFNINTPKVTHQKHIK